MRFRRPSIAFTIAFLIVLTVLVALGVWQTQRLSWKTALIAERAERLAQPAAAIGAVANPDDWSYRLVRATGAYRDVAPVHMGAPKLKGRVGRNVIGALRLTRGRFAGRGLLVLRGWAPLAASENSGTTNSPPPGDNTLLGWVRLPRRGSALTRLVVPADQPDERYWITMNIPAMATSMEIGDPLPFFLHLKPTADDIGGPPVAYAPEVTANNPHLSYALTWFGLAIVAVVMFVMFHWRRPGDDAGSSGEGVA